jgi:hypothetical protein
MRYPKEKLQNHKESHGTMSDIYLEQQAKNLEAADDERVALMRKQIIKAEEIKKMYMKLRRHLKPQGCSTLNSLMVPTMIYHPKLLSYGKASMTQ